MTDQSPEEFDLEAELSVHIESMETAHKNLRELDRQVIDAKQSIETERVKLSLFRARAAKIISQMTREHVASLNTPAEILAELES